MPLINQLAGQLGRFTPTHTHAHAQSGTHTQSGPHPMHATSLNSKSYCDHVVHCAWVCFAVDVAAGGGNVGPSILTDHLNAVFAQQEAGQGTSPSHVCVSVCVSVCVCVSCVCECVCAYFDVWLECLDKHSDASCQATTYMALPLCSMPLSNSPLSLHAGSVPCCLCTERCLCTVPRLSLHAD